MKNLIQGRYVPENAQEILQEETNHVVYLYENYSNQICAMAYGGKRKKADWAYSFKSVEKRKEYVDNYLAERIKVEEYKVQQKKEAKERKAKDLAEVKVGDIFHCGWGYEQTQCDFYQIQELKGSTATIVEIGSKTEEGSEGRDCEYQLADPSRTIGEPFKKRLNGKSFKISSFQYVSKVENPETQSFYCSWYY